MGKPSEQMSNFWTVRFSKTESELNFGLLHIPSSYIINSLCQYTGSFSDMKLQVMPHTANFAPHHIAGCCHFENFIASQYYY